VHASTAVPGQSAASCPAIRRRPRPGVFGIDARVADAHRDGRSMLRICLDVLEIAVVVGRNSQNANPLEVELGGSPLVPG